MALFREVQEVELGNGRVLRCVRENGEQSVLLTINVGDDVLGYRVCIRLTLRQAMKLSRSLAGISAAIPGDRADTDPG